MLFKQTMIQFLSLKRVNGMDSIKLLDKVIMSWPPEIPDSRCILK
ncbi:hypothetical protein MUTS3_01540 (plasmid) [Escherichia coli]|nr:hypothetical protein MUTS3_01540 [Escherichia coli]